MPLKDVILTKKVERHIEKHAVTREEIMWGAPLKVDSKLRNKKK